MACTMDYIFYRAIIMYLYEVPTLEDLEANLKSYSGDQLNDFLAKQHNRPASKLDIKETMVIQYILQQKVDVMCLQEAGCIDWKEELIPGYSHHKLHDSVLLYRRDKLGDIRTDLMEQYGE
jgi:mRNA deadenylase 3'-5' endonuclease subunit Ccr4